MILEISSVCSRKYAEYIAALAKAEFYSYAETIAVVAPEYPQHVYGNLTRSVQFDFCEFTKPIRP